MATEGSVAGRELFDGINIDYEHAYRHNTLKIDCIKHAISMLKPSSRVLDVGCGTGIPVAQLLSNAGMDVVGIDIAPQMVDLAAKRVKGTFKLADMVDWQPDGIFDAVFIIFSHLQLDYASVHSMCYKYARALNSDGLFAIGQSPADCYVKTKEDEAYFDETKAYVENFNIPFWGKPCSTFAMTQGGQKKFLISMGLEIVDEIVDVFKPENPICDPEHQQYVIAKRVGEIDIREPKPLPKKKNTFFGS